MKYDVFISYSSHDQKVVEGLCAYLEQYKIRCFVAYRDIPRGVVWARAIVDALDESRMMVVVFSEHFNNSDQVDREIELASEDKKPILTFRISNDAFKGAKKYYLKNINWIDAFPNPEQVFGSVVENVSSLLGIQLSHVAQSSLQTTSKQDGGSTQSAKRYKVGEYYDDGKKQGVVFEVSADGKHGKIVSLDEARLSWCTPSQFDKKIAVGAYSESDGRANTDKVMSRTDSEKYPAFTWCRDKGVDWYLPSVGELSSLSKVKDKINKALVAQSREKLRNGLYRYWSSTERNLKIYPTECSCNVNMSNGEAYCPNKTNKGYVRAVATF